MGAVWVVAGCERLKTNTDSAEHQEKVNKAEWHFWQLNYGNQPILMGACNLQR